MSSTDRCQKCGHLRANHELVSKCVAPNCLCDTQVKPEPPPALQLPPPRVTRERLPDERASYTREFSLGYTHKDGTPDTMCFVFTAGLYPDGRLGEVFVEADRTGTLVSGALDAVATMISLLLQYGVPLPVITSKLRHTRYPPAGFTRDAKFPSCSSPMDLLAQWLDKGFGGVA